MFTLIRYTRTEKSILGSLYLNGAFICYTLENAAKSIPAGLYSIENSKSPKFGRELPLLFSDKVPSRRGVRRTTFRITMYTLRVSSGRLISPGIRSG